MIKILFCAAFLSLFSSICLASDTTVIEVASKSMNKKINATIVTPDSYTTSQTRYPVVYLLHGHKNDHTNWPRHVKKLVDQYQVIAVCPDANIDSWYFDSPLRPEYRYETFISKELVNHIDNAYRTEAKREQRAIAGASMGGHGALYLAMRNPKVFGAVGGMSGGLDIRPFHRGFGINTHLGDIKKDSERFEAHSAINNINKIKDGELAIMIDCGDKDFFIEVNRAFVAELKRQGISHTYQERPGSHGWIFWKDSIKIHMEFFDDYFNSPNIPAKTR